MNRLLKYMNKYIMCLIRYIICIKLGLNDFRQSGNGLLAVSAANGQGFSFN